MERSRYDELSMKLHKQREKFLSDVTLDSFATIPNGINKINDFLAEYNEKVIGGYQFRIYQERKSEYTLRAFYVYCIDTEISGSDIKELVKIALRYYRMNEFI